ncbi:Zinc-type alcohol dehydrogenase-like protein C16A3.02c [Daldinia childiae]|uniref:Zinc-type alcohol dehydrogenase-like protein C16A3.02c n=1 Tax=Daldinia childiae TaxID=326645 RepID=UPI0014474B60|nr:Zinc-type alcohol dehydrogenase-like protein C16A3.02c [Daldinia childiae]KAF3064609.1 Zinc-type alcohol dehydrogenase-like protein C16A3.02c [Daldinia childiae]
MVNIPKTMKAWIVTRTGKLPGILELKTNWPTPTPPKTGEIMIRVSYAALNPGEIKVMAMAAPCRVNTIAGMDFVGEVIQIGPTTPKSHSDVRVGMIVGGTVPLMNMWRGAGALSEYLVLPAHTVVEKPKGLDESVAAGLLGIAGQTNAVIMRAANLHQGDKVLINGASGGVGCISIQVLRGMGVHVTAICSAKNEAFVRRLGAEEVIDYNAHKSLPDYLTSVCAEPGNRPFDAIFNNIKNEPLYTRSPKYLKPNGKYLDIEAGPFGYFKLSKWWPVILGGTPRTHINILSRPSSDSAKDAAAWIEKGWIKEIPVDSTFEMDNALQAYERMVSNRATGKIFVKVK